MYTAVVVRELASRHQRNNFLEILPNEMREYCLCFDRPIVLIRAIFRILFGKNWPMAADDIINRVRAWLRNPSMLTNVSIFYTSKKIFKS